VVRRLEGLAARGEGAAPERGTTQIQSARSLCRQSVGVKDHSREPRSSRVM
jgi:hypothetical protein